MSNSTQAKRDRTSHFPSPWFFFLLVILLSIPFYVMGEAGGRLPIATFLPMSALMAFIPMVASLILVHRAQGARAAGKLLARAWDASRIRGVGWIVVATLLMPSVFLTVYGVLRLAGGTLPEAQLFPLTSVVSSCVMLFLGAIGEELGWQGYAYGGLEREWSALNAALIIGIVWALWHVIPYAQLGRSASWIVWQCLGTIALRVIVVWLFVNTGRSVFVAALFHTTINGPWGVFPAFESYFDPFVLFVLLSLIAGVIIALWGASTLARFRHARVTT